MDHVPPECTGFFAHVAIYATLAAVGLCGFAGWAALTILR
jgi:hypothetical protein